MQTDYYEPLNIFRHNAITVRKRGGESSFNKDWQLNIQSSYERKQQLRRCSDDYNDYYNRKKLQTDFWKLDKLVGDSSVSNDMALLDEQTLCLSNTREKDNINIFQLDNTHMKKLKTISIPSKPITQLCALPHLQDDNSQHFLTGHRNGVVNLISTSEENSQINRKFNHFKYMERTNKEKLQSPSSIPIRQLSSWVEHNSFISLVNESMFVYNLEDRRNPTYLDSHPGLHSVNISNNNNDLIFAMQSGVKIFDIRSPKLTSVYNSLPVNVTETINDYELAIGNTNGLEFIDIRMTNEVISSCLVNEKKSKFGSIRNLKYNSKLKELYCLDAFGNLFNWDISIPSQTRLLKNGFQRTTNQTGLECGDLIVNSRDIRTIQLWRESVIGLGFEELSVHRIVNVKQRIITEEEQEEPILPHQVSSSDEDVETDVTSIWDEDMNQDSATIVESPIPNKNETLYSLEKFSESTIHAGNNFSYNYL